MTKSEFFRNNRIGLLLRVFAQKPEQINGRVEMIASMVQRALNLKVHGHSVFSSIDVVVWNNQRRFPGVCDCGQTAGALRRDSRLKHVEVHDYKNGDLFCGILNWGYGHQMSRGCTYTTIASSEALDYFTELNMANLIEAACDGALATGLAINELEQSVLEGRLANTFCMWHNSSLQSVGGFDLRAAKKPNDKEILFTRGWHRDKGFVFYALSGVEEVIPLAQLVAEHGECIAPVLPQGDGAQRYRVPDPVTQKDLYERHIEKLGNKEPRQRQLLSDAGYEMSFLEGGVMKNYRLS